LKLLLANGVQVCHGLRDPRILHWLRDPDANAAASMEDCWNSLEDLKLRCSWHTIVTKYIQAIKSDGYVKERAMRINEVIKDTAASYALYDELARVCGFTPETQDNARRYPGLKSLFEDLEMPLLPIIAEMEFCGVGFDADMFADMRNRMESKAEYLEKRATALFGTKVDLNSPMAVAEALFGGSKPLMQYPIDVKPGQKLSSKKMILQMVSDHILPCIILEHRKLMHTINTYLDPLPRYAHLNKTPILRGQPESSSFTMRRIYATCLQTNVPTGRIASDNPNLQSIPNAFDYTPLPDCMMNHSGSEDVGSPNGKSYRTRASSSEDSLDRSPFHVLATQKPIRVSIRDSFIATPGFIMVSCDYRHLELRIMAHFSQDQVLIPLLQDPSQDVFQMMASVWFKKDPQKVNSSERAKAKAVCYGLLYGKGNKALATDLECTYDQAKLFIRDFKSTFRGIEGFIFSTHKYVEENGSVETLLGRRRCLAGSYSAIDEEKSSARRKAVNTKCQGTAADIVKTAMVRIWWELFLPITDLCPRMLINLHDELLFEVPEANAIELSRKIQDIMENSITLPGIPLPVKVRVGPSWGSLLPIEDYLKPTALDFQNVHS
jgi:DNA polymerase theta